MSHAPLNSSRVVAAAFFLSCSATLTLGAVIVSPAGVVQNTASERNNRVDLANAFDRSGLLPSFESGVTDFDSYIAMNPLHSLRAFNNEWFAPTGVATGIIDWDLGSQLTIDRAAIWNEEASGLERLRISASNEAGFSVSTLLGDFTLTENPRDSDYPADISCFCTNSN